MFKICWKECFSDDRLGGAGQKHVSHGALLLNRHVN